MNFSSGAAGNLPAQPHVLLPHAGVLEIADAVFEENLIVGFESSDEDARPFNLLRAQILRSVEATGRRLIGITSATPAAGKTFLSINLAAALSRIANRAVVLCDFDLRRGSVLKTLQGEVPNELSAYLRGDVSDWTTALYRLGDTDLYVVPCKARARGSSELLGTAAFQRLVSGLRSLPQEVIVLADLPPVFASDDALLTAENLDAYLLVVEYGRNTASQVQETLRLLEPAVCLGTVLNRYKGGFFDAYGYGYGDRYGLKNYGAES